MRTIETILAAALGLAASANAQEPAPGPVPVPTVSNPHWLKLPTGDDLARFYPATAGGRSGAARMRCVVTSRGTLDKCAVLSETPDGAGFGGAALLLAPLFVMAPRTENGTPVGGAVIVIPLKFQGPGGPSAPIHAIKVTSAIAWSAAPTAEALAGAYPAEAAGHTASGHVVLRCGFAHDGALRDCQVMTEAPASMGFARAARGLAKDFRAYDDADYLKRIHDVYVDVPFDFHDPSHPGPPLELINPVWLQGADPGMAGQLFPEAAAKAGLTTGVATLVCQAAHDGSLKGCAVAAETPPGLGFGEAALTIASVMKMNPWTQQGAPVDGARIRLPVRVNLHAGPTMTPAAKP